jgi:hypothetical protein
MREVLSARLIGNEIQRVDYRTIARPVSGIKPQKYTVFLTRRSPRHYFQVVGLSRDDVPMAVGVLKREAVIPVRAP